MTQIMDRIMNELRVALPGAIDPAIEHALGETMWEFCDVSGAWKSPCAVAISPTVVRYTVEPEDGYPIRLASIVDANGRVYDAEFVPPDAVDFHRALEGVDAVIITLIVAPDPSTPLGMPDELITAYRAALMDGVKARMMAQIAKPWSNPTFAAVHLRRFTAETGRARAHASRQRTIAGQRWSFPRTFAVRRTH
jgi:hypothetical protein